MSLIRLKIPLLVALSACSNSVVQPREPSAPAVTLAVPSPTRVQGDVVAQETALVTLELGADGSVTLSGVTRKPIPYRGSRLLPVEHPFDAVSHPGASLRTAREPAPERASYVLVVQPPGVASLARVVPLDLGARGEGGGRCRRSLERKRGAGEGAFIWRGNPLHRAARRPWWLGAAG